jgi:poly-gamma-glutamate capsule biosynthesis protein CapA/YwtB (metallophosphatase superfamily)
LKKKVNIKSYPFLIAIIITASCFFVWHYATAPKKVRIIALGDIMLGRHVGELIHQGVDPFQYIRFDNSSFPQSLIPRSDMVMANLEGPITTAENCQDKAYSFKFATTSALLLKARGIKAVSQANNHSQDCYEQGFLDTQKYLKSAGVTYFGGFVLKDLAKEITINGVHVALVGLDMTVSPPPSATVYSLIKTLKTRNAYVIVNIHWGIEYSKTANAEQIAVAHKLIDSGVDVIIGNHPHVVEPIETYKGKTIFYSLGNFIFDQTDPEAKVGMLVHVTLSSDGTQMYKIYKYTINHSQPKLN